nr:type II toxin-antitoxin system VapC family toxin [Microbacterium protaetiae]
MDTSVLGRVLLRHSPPALSWFEDAAEQGALVSSRLLRTEMTRLVRREGLRMRDRDEILDYVATIPLDHPVLMEAEAIVPHVRTLDAIHLASALRAGIEDLVVATHDARMLDVAEIMGFRVVDPCVAP